MCWYIQTHLVKRFNSVLSYYICLFTSYMSSNRLDIKHIYTLTELSNSMSYRVVSDYRIMLKIEIK